MNKETMALMEKMTQMIGISGSEKEVCRLLQKEMEPYCDDFIYDNLGSVFGVKKCGKPNAKKVMVCAHMDEVGFIVTGIETDGSIKMIPVGNIEKDHALYHRVRGKSGDKEWKGCIISVSDKKDEFFVHVGADSIQDAEHMGIQLGDSVVLDGAMEVLDGGKRIVSKAWNDRFGCVMAVELLKALKDSKLDVDLYIGAVVQMEVGNRGATTSTNRIVPDMAVVLDVVNEERNAKDMTSGKLGKGVVVKYYDKGMMPNRALLQAYQNICEMNNIPYQMVYNMATADTAWVHKLQTGCPTLTGAVVIQNNYTASQILDTEDFEHVKTALTNLLQGLHEQDVNSFKEENR